jgi:hypothetical protein
VTSIAPPSHTRTVTATETVTVTRTATMTKTATTTVKPASEAPSGAEAASSLHSRNTTNNTIVKQGSTNKPINKIIKIIPPPYDLAVYPDKNGLYRLVNSNGTLLGEGDNITALLSKAINTLKGKGGIILVKDVELRIIPSLPGNIMLITSYNGVLKVYGLTSIEPWRFQIDHINRLPRPPERLISDFENASNLLRESNEGLVMDDPVHHVSGRQGVMLVSRNGEIVFADVVGRFNLARQHVGLWIYIDNVSSLAELTR